MKYTKEQKIILLIIALSSFLNPFLASSINVALVKMEHFFSINSLMTNWILNSYLIASTITLLPAGKFSDILGQRKIFLFGIIVYTISSFFSIYVKSINFFIILRVLQGFGSAIMMAVSTVILISNFPKNERGKVLGINVASVYAGLSTGPAIGGILIHKSNWQSIFILNTLIGIFIFFLSYKYLKKDLNILNENISLKSITIYALSIFSFLYGFSKITNIFGLFLTLFGIFLFLFLLKFESSNKKPILDIKIFRYNLFFLFSNLSALINYTSTTAISFFLSLYLQNLKLLSAQTTGFILMIQPIFMTFLSPYAGKLSDKVEPRLIASSGMFLLNLSLFLFLFLNKETSLIYIIISLSIAGIGFAFFSSPNTNAIMHSVENKYYGSASGFLSTMRTFGQTFSMTISTLIFSIYLKNNQIISNTDAFLKSTKISFLIFTILSSFGLYFSLKRGKIKNFI